MRGEQGKSKKEKEGRAREGKGEEKGGGVQFARVYIGLHFNVLIMLLF